MLKKWTTQLAEMIEGPLPENRKRRDGPLTFKVEYLQSIRFCSKDIQETPLHVPLLPGHNATIS